MITHKRHAIRVSKLLLGLVYTLLASGTNAQSDNNPDYIRFPIIPAFSLLQIDSSQFTREQLSKEKNTIIMLFNPDCSHCREQTDSLLAHANELDNIQIVMATYSPMEKLRAFHQEYNMSAYKNFILGRDTRYFLIPFYEAANVPFLGLYDQKGALVKTFDSGTSVAFLVRAFQKSEH